MNAAFVLKEGIHDRLRMDMEHISSMSRVPAAMIESSSQPHLTEGMLEWLRSFHTLRGEGKASAYIEGEQTKPIDKAMMAMAAALIRNFIDARVIPVTTLLESDLDTMVTPTVIFVPNFQIGYDGKPMASWQLQKLHSLLLDRMVHDKVTVVYAESFPLMEKVYGKAMCDHILENYTKL